VFGAWPIGSPSVYLGFDCGAGTIRMVPVKPLAQQLFTEIIEIHRDLDTGRPSRAGHTRRIPREQSAVDPALLKAGPGVQGRQADRGRRGARTAKSACAMHST
jgi:hypothetical protein